MTEVSPSMKPKLSGRIWHLFIDFKMPCQGRIAAYRLYAYAAGTLYVTVMEDIGSFQFKMIGVNTLSVPSSGYHVSLSHNRLPSVVCDLTKCGQLLKRIKTSSRLS